MSGGGALADMGVHAIDTARFLLGDPEPARVAAVIGTRYGDYGVDDFSPLPAQELDIYREALLIFYGKVSIYLRLMGRELPRHWQEWIG